MLRILWEKSRFRRLGNGRDRIRTSRALPSGQLDDILQLPLGFHSYHVVIVMVVVMATLIVIDTNSNSNTRIERLNDPRGFSCVTQDFGRDSLDDFSIHLI